MSGQDRVPFCDACGDLMEETVQVDGEGEPSIVTIEVYVCKGCLDGK